MARLPGDRYIMQQIGGEVVIFRQGTEEEIVRFNPRVSNAVTMAQLTIHENPEMTAEEKCFAHFWSGYFYAHANGAGGL